MLTLHVGPEHPLHRGRLRWGFLAIGAFSFMDAFDTWWGARSDFDRIPFGMIDGRRQRVFLDVIGGLATPSPKSANQVSHAKDVKTFGHLPIG